MRTFLTLLIMLSLGVASAYKHNVRYVPTYRTSLQSQKKNKSFFEIIGSTVDANAAARKLGGNVRSNSAKGKRGMISSVANGRYSKQPVAKKQQTAPSAPLPSPP